MKSDGQFTFAPADFGLAPAFLGAALTGAALAWGFFSSAFGLLDFLAVVPLANSTFSAHSVILEG